MLSCLAIDGRCGMTAFAETAAGAETFYSEAVAALS
jgi:hypothetical protein